MALDPLFKALADPSRRRLLERLRARNGQNLAQLCGGLALSRPAVAKHLGILQKAGLVAVQWRGREKRHFLDTAPIHEAWDGWASKFERPEQAAAIQLERALELARRAGTQR
jgi:DNA-binding transcriptional ArsR family regulator